MVTQTLEKIKTPIKCFRYNQEEKEIIRQNFNGKRLNTERIIDIIILRCGKVRSYNGIRTQANLLGLTKCSRRWTNEELETLTEMVGRCSLRNISKTLKRTRDSIHHKLEKLKLSANLRNGWYNSNDVTNIFGVGHKTVKLWIDMGILKATKEANGYHILSKDLKLFILKYPMELTGRNIDLVQYNAILCPQFIKDKD